MLTEKETNALRYAGFMGHEFAVLDDKFRLSAECNTAESARESCEECNGTAYQKINKEWVKIS